MKSKFKSSVLCVIFIIAMMSTLLAGVEWNPESGSDDIHIYSKQSLGFKLKEFKGECEVPASLAAVKAVMMDYENYEKWFAMSRQITLIHKTSPTSFTMNYIVASPWPIADRETDVLITIKFDETAGKGVVLLDAIQSSDNIGKSGLIRINDLQGRFEFTRLSQARTRVVLYMRVDPRIDLPVKLQNNVIMDYPTNTLQGLNKILDSDKKNNS